MAQDRNAATGPRALEQLRSGLLEQRSAATLGPDELEAALEMRRLRAELSVALGPLHACSKCGQDEPLPAGRWDGGRCCSDPAAELFDAETLGHLRAAGTEAEDLAGPCDERAGCLMRGPAGCALPREHRPNACVGYLCDALLEELAARGDLDAVQMKRLALAAAERRFTGLRALREEAEAFARDA